MKRNITFLILSAAFASAMATVELNSVIPLPLSATSSKGVFKVTSPQELDSKSVVSKTDSKLPFDYTIDIKPKGIIIKGRNAEGIFHGRQTLRQLFDNALSTDSLVECGRIEDTPAFDYRGLHMDVSRHFRDVAFVKKQIDAMARLKLNRLHLHLTDAAGWRMPIDSYPLLDSVAAWRPERTWKGWAANGHRYGGNHGGFYTKDDLREIIRYAGENFIEVIPEIEMPGHSEEVIAVYPQLSCNGTGGDFCPGKEDTFKFIETVLDEVMEVFPTNYIHIGGDEAGKGAWKDCPDCKKRMEQEGFTEIDQLQSYLIKRVEKYVNSKGRDIIGWDEILQGGLAPNATVMSWRDPKDAIKAFEEGHRVIMTPGDACYLDYTQDAPFREPESIGGYLPLEKVYNYSMPEGLYGIQANLWSEYITDESHAEYMYYPRTFAVAENAWNNSAVKDYPSFRKRTEMLSDKFMRDGYTVFDIRNEFGNRPETYSTVDHIARGAKVTYAKKYTRMYPAAGDGTLTDGIRGGWTYQDKKWQGWFQDLDLTVDLGKAKPINYISTTFMHSPGPGVFLPDSIVIDISKDGKEFTNAAVLRSDISPDYPKIHIQDFGTPVSGEARYIRIQGIRNRKTGGCLFIDEIIVK